MTKFINTLYTADCLYTLHGLENETIDLIYLDPPFNSNKNFSAPIGSVAAGTSFEDMWTWKDVDKEYLGEMINDYPFMVNVIQAIDVMHSKSMKAYITYMGQRLIEMKRVLKPSGTIYLHCDPVASHYLKIIMDRLFGKSNFRSDIIWKRSQPKNDSKSFGNNNDRILMYTKSNKFTFNKTYSSYDHEYIKKQYKHVEKNSGRLYRPGPLDAHGLQGGGYEYEWNGREHLWRLPKKSMEKLHNEGKIHYSSKGLANKKLYLDEAKGVPVQSLWDDIKFVKGKEDTGYPTQKPLELLRRIIKTSSNEGDIVLDPFCGCATACVASQQLNRKWIGIDISEVSPQIVASRIQSDAGIFTDFIHLDCIKDPKKYPKRESLKKLNKANSKNDLYKQQKGICKGCEVYFDSRHLEVDHIIPKSKNGPDAYENYQLLCGHCNKVKGNRPMAFLKMRLNKINERLKFQVSFGEGD
jgi:DNA modification methylase